MLGLVISFPTEHGLGRNRSDPLKLFDDEIPVALGERHAVRHCARGSIRAILRAMISEGKNYSLADLFNY